MFSILLRYSGAKTYQKYLSEATQVCEPIYPGGPTQVSFDLWRCPVYKLEPRPFNHPPVCGQIINLRKITDKLALRSSMALMETEFRKVFNEAICLHIREHMNRFGLDFDSNVCILMQIL